MRALWGTVALLTWMAGCVSWSMGRGLLGEYTTFGAANLKLLGVPRDAELLLQSKGNCGNPPPIQYRPQMALLCELNAKTRACLNISSTVPFFNGMCSGQSCTMDFLHEPSSCFFSSFGIELDSKNASRNATCGFKPEDSGWLTPGPNPFALPSKNGSSTTCASATPPDVTSQLWAPCVNGEPRLRLRLAFKRPMAKNYTCVLAPTCKNAEERNRLVCYIAKSQMLFSGAMRSAAAEGRAWHSLCWGVSALVAAIFVAKMLPH